MYLSLWAITALCLSACNGGPDSSDSPEGGSGGGNTSTPQPGEGGIKVHAVYGDSTEICQVNDEFGEDLGNTGEDILGLKPGVFNFALGDPDMTTLDGQPFHVTEGSDYTIGSGAVEVLANKVIEVQVELELEPYHQCVSIDCDFPYEGDACGGNVYTDPEQWIYVDANGTVRGTEVPDVIGGVRLTLIDGVFTATPLDASVIEHASLNGSTISVTYSNEPFEVAQQVTCSHR